MFNQTIRAVRLIPGLLPRRSMSQSPMQGQVSCYTPNSLEKRFLVWTGKYKTVKEVPSLVSAEVMERCRNKVRIRLANIMMFLTVVGCCIMIYSGKEAAKRGETVSRQNIEWHKKYNEAHGKQEKNE